MDAETFQSGKKSLRIQKYPDTFGRGLNGSVLDVNELIISSDFVLFYLETNDIIQENVCN